MYQFPSAALSAVNGALYNNKGDNRQVQKDGGQSSIGDIFGGLANEVVTGARDYARYRVQRELYESGVPGYTIDPLGAPYSNGADGAPAAPVPQNDAAPLALAGLAGLAFAFLS